MIKGTVDKPIQVCDVCGREQAVAPDVAMYTLVTRSGGRRGVDLCDDCFENRGEIVETADGKLHRVRRSAR